MWFMFSSVNNCTHKSACNMILCDLCNLSCQNLLLPVTYDQWCGSGSAWIRIRNYYFFFVYLFLASGGGSPLYLEFLQHDTMILQRPRIIEGDAGFEPGTSASEVWRATNEPPHHLPMSHQITTNEPPHHHIRNYSSGFGSSKKWKSR